MSVQQRTRSEQASRKQLRPSRINAIRDGGYMHIDVNPIATALGAEIQGVDIAAPISDAMFEEIHRAWLEHHVLVFRNQQITPHQHLAFARRFGEIHIHPFNKPLADHPEILEILKTEEMRSNNGARWHSDQMYTANPAKATMLVAREMPPCGGDTLFANLHASYEALSPAFTRMLESLRGINNGDSRKHYGMTRAERAAAGIGTMPQKETADPVATISVHPLIRTHPETGRNALYFGSHTECFDDMSMEESAGLLAWLTDFASKPEFTCRVHWEVGTVTIWDNRCTQHLAINDYDGHRRCMHKVTIQGDTPYLAAKV